jgi:glycosyltransferase involved in cell wall biosynthesis
MRIALCSKAFLPNVGGIETSSAMMAKIWQAAGHEVEVITAVSDAAPASEPYMVTRVWTLKSLMTGIRLADIVVVNGYSRVAIAASVIGRRGAIVFHQGYQLICSDGLGFRGRCFHGFDTWKDIRLAFGAGLRSGLQAIGRVPFDAIVKRLRNRVQHVVPSHHVAKRLSLDNFRVVYQPPNPAVIETLGSQGAYTEDLRTSAYESGDIVFFGRLVFEKGCDDLIRAYALWRQRSAGDLRRKTIPRLVIYGQGPEQTNLENLVTSLQITEHVDLRPFVGGRELVRVAREASVVVIPSSWEEPGGTIGVELFACGAAVIASERGVFGEIFKDHGRLFSNRDVDGLADALGQHFAIGPIYPRPTGREPWLFPAIEREVLGLIS